MDDRYSPCLPGLLLCVVAMVACAHETAIAPDLTALIKRDPAVVAAAPRCTLMDRRACEAFGQAVRTARARLECERGDCSACFRVAWDQPPGQSKSNAGRHAARVCQRRCKDKDVRACSDVAYMMSQGAWLPKDTTAALALWAAACESGSRAACRNAVILARDVPNGEAPGRAALTRLSQRCDDGSVEDCLALGRLDDIAATLVPGMADGMARAVSLYFDRCAAGDAQACGEAARLYLFREEGEREANDRLAATFAERGCKGGDGYACGTLAMLLGNGQGVAKNAARSRLVARRATGLFRKACRPADLMSDPCVAMRRRLGNHPTHGGDPRTLWAQRVAACFAEGGEECVLLPEVTRLDRTLPTPPLEAPVPQFDIPPSDAD